MTSSNSPASSNPPANRTGYLRPYPVPQWIEERGRFAFSGECLGELLPPAEVAAQGINIMARSSNGGGIGFAGGPYVWDGAARIYNMWTGETVDEEAIRARVDAAHRAGIKVAGELIRMWHPEMLYVQHPEWQELPSPDAKPRGPERKKEWPPVTGCWNSPYGEFFIRQNVELARRLKWDAHNLDGFGCWTHCFCPACRESYRGDMGKEIPATEDLNDIEFRLYLKWRLNRFTHFVQRWQTALKEYNPDYVSMPWISGPGRWWHWMFAPGVEGSEACVRLLDAPFLELFWDFPANQGTNLLPSFTVRFYRGLRAEKPMFMWPYFCTQGQQRMMAPRVEREFRILTVLTNGARAAQSSHQLPEGDDFTPYSKLIAEREPWTLGAKSIKWAALLVSESSRLLYGIRGQRSELSGAWGWIGSGTDTPDSVKNMPAGERPLPAHMESAIGAFRAAQEEHLPLDMINEQDVEEAAGDAAGVGGELKDVANADDQFARLNLYRVLILPNAACLSDAACAAIRKFVANGGGVVAFHESSVCDENGTRRDDFGLADLFKARFVGTEDHTARWPNYPSCTCLSLAKHAITDDPLISDCKSSMVNYHDYIGMTTNVRAGEGAMVVIQRGQDSNAIQIAEPYTVGAENEAKDEGKVGGDAGQGGDIGAQAGDDKVKEAKKAGLPAEEKIEYPWERETPAVDKTVHPFLILSNYGKGRVAYFAADVAQSYLNAPYQYERKIIANAIRWAANDETPPVEVEAPMCVQATFYEQKKGEKGAGEENGRREEAKSNRVIVHLLNEINTMTDRALPESNSPMREEVVPITGIRVRFADREIASAYLEPEHESLPVRRTEKGCEVTVPRLGMHSMVVAE